MEGLGSAHHCRHGLESYPDHIVVRLLGRKRTASRLRMKPQRTGIIPFGLKSLFHNLCPEPSSRPEFCHLFNEIIMATKEKGEPGGEGIDIETGSNRCLHISDPVCQ